jgi:hypothetical protein
MFRQTLMRSCAKREIRAAATNDSNDRTRVTFSLIGEEEKLSLLCEDLLRLEKLNSWGAHADSLNVLTEFIEFENHQVTTDNVDDFNWTPGVEFYL